MKRVAVLVVGLSVVVPFLVGIVTTLPRATSMDPRFRRDSPDSARDDGVLLVWLDRSGRRIPAGILCTLGTHDHDDCVAPAQPAGGRLYRHIEAGRARRRADYDADCRRRAGEIEDDEPAILLHPAGERKPKKPAKGATAPLPDAGMKTNCRRSNC